ncbi:hypothetical protein OC834_006450, partial [Tilletia horrida]
TRHCICPPGADPDHEQHKGAVQHFGADGVPGLAGADGARAGHDADECADVDREPDVADRGAAVAVCGRGRGAGRERRQLYPDPGARGGEGGFRRRQWRAAAAAAAGLEAGGVGVQEDGGGAGPGGAEPGVGDGLRRLSADHGGHEGGVRALRGADVRAARAEAAV